MKLSAKTKGRVAPRVDLEVAQSARIIVKVKRHAGLVRHPGRPDRRRAERVIHLEADILPYLDGLVARMGLLGIGWHARYCQSVLQHVMEGVVAIGAHRVITGFADVLLPSEGLLKAAISSIEDVVLVYLLLIRAMGIGIGLWRGRSKQGRRQDVSRETTSPG
jgi:hypothetical protein